MDTNRKILSNPGSAAGAELRRVPGGNLDDSSGSFFRFPAQYIEEPKPSCVSYRPVKSCTAIPEVHLLNADGIVEVHKLVGYLKVKVPPLVGDFLMSFGYKDASLIPPVGAFNSPGEPLLAHGQNIPRPLKEAGVADFHTFGGSQKGLKADINTYHFIVGGKRFQWNILAGEAGVPFARRATADGNRFDSALYRAGKPELESADVPDSEVFAIQLPTSLFQREGVVAVPTLESREACFAITILYSAKEALVGFVQALKHVLEHLRADISIFRESCFKLRKLLNLLIAGNENSVMPVGGDALLQGSVVEMTAQRKPTLGFFNSLRAGINSIFKRLFPLHNLSIAHSEKGGKPCRASLSVSPL